MTVEQMITYDQIVELGIATPDEINLAYNMTDKGWDYTLDQIIYVRTGYRTLTDYINEEGL